MWRSARLFQTEPFPDLREEGLWQVLILTGKPAGARLRQRLSKEILPQLHRTGTYTLPQPEPTPAVDTEVPKPKRQRRREEEISLGPVSPSPAVRTVRRVLDALRGHGVDEAAYRALSATLVQVEGLKDLATCLEEIPVEGPLVNRGCPEYRRLLDSVEWRFTELSSHDLQRVVAWMNTRPMVAGPRLLEVAR